MTEYLNKTLGAWVAWVCRYPWRVLIAITILTSGSAWYGLANFRINSDLSGLIDQHSSWRADFDEFEAAFPNLLKTAVVVVHGDSFGDVEQASKSIEAAIRAEPRFTSVSAPQNLPFLRDHALLYLSDDDLDEMSDRLAEAQPVLTAIAEDPSLRGVLEVLADGAENAGDEAAFETVLELVTKSGRRTLAEHDAKIRWTDELFSPDPPQIRVISLKGSTNFDVSLPSGEMIELLRRTITSVPLPAGVETGITGEIALTHEEISAATGGVNLAGWISTLFLTLVMIIGVRSIKIVVVTLLMLLYGVTITTAWAMFAVGEFNTLSLVFIVMFFGLGVDYSLHFSLRYQEAINEHDDRVSALVHATKGVGDAIFLCMITTAISFLAFWPTRYGGLADLGVISAGGMVVAFLLTFSMIPALFVVFGDIRPHRLGARSSDGLVKSLIAHRGLVLTTVVVASLGASWYASRAHFDYSVLALRDESTESMRMLRFLQDEGVATDYALSIVHEPGHLKVEELEALPMVRAVITPEDFVPKDQDDKLFAIEELGLLLESAVIPISVLPSPTIDELRIALNEFAGILRASNHSDAALYTDLAELSASRLRVWQSDVVDGLVSELEWLRRALSVGPITLDDLPEGLRERFINADGKHLSVVLPKRDITDVASLGSFIDAVQGVEPKATGRPVIEKGVGEIVIDSFVQATLMSAVAIFVILLLVFRSVVSAFYIALPLLLAALFTLALGELLDAPLNMANILVLPLIFGLGVDNGIHVFHRFRAAGDVDSFMHSSTPLATLLSTLTTVGAFSSLMLSPHVGTASIGLYLTMAVGMLLVFAVFLLPVLLQKSK